MKRHSILLGALSLLLAGCPPPNLQPEICGDGADNDQDGLTDCGDSDCAQDPSCLQEICADGADNDEDSLVDCADPDCAGSPVCLEVCGNGADDDLDGLLDCQDPDCDADPGCTPEDDCGNGLDDDFDGLLDCDDLDCEGDPACNLEGDCFDGVDNDGDALIDAADPGCISGQNDEADDQCNDGVDNDFDGEVDANDPECGLLGHEADPNALPDLIIFDQREEVFTDQFGAPTPDGQPLIRLVGNVESDDPEFLEGCFSGTGTRKILEWNSYIGNIGDAALFVGNTSNHQPIWNNDNELGGLQFSGWTRALLFDTEGNLVASGHKPSFCMIDIFDLLQQQRPSTFNSCLNNQGISVNFADIYSIGLACQFIDITNVPTGQSYVLRVETNFTRQLPEKDYTNNSSDFDIFIP